jgi:hypothetical protein
VDPELPATPVSIFGSAPVLRGEDSQAYDELLTQVSSDVKPSDIIEQIWIRDIVDLTWEIQRWRRVKTSIIARAVPNALRQVLAPLAEADENSEWMNALIKAWVGQKPSAIKRVNKLLASRKLTFDRVIARALTGKFEFAAVERIDRCITIVEGRRNGILREIDRRRAVFAQALRNKVQEVEDAEFETIEPKAIVSTGTAESAA